MNKRFLLFISFSLSFSIHFAQNIELVKSFANNSVPKDIIEFNSQLFFSADDGVNGRELWVSDGTTSGTTLFKNILSGGSSSPEQLKVLGNKFYFIALETISPARKALYVSDGTVAGTIKLTSLSTNSNNITATTYYEIVNNKVYFKNDINGLGSELWMTDGTVAGTVMLKDIYTSTPGSSPDNFCAFNGKLFFNANDGIHGKELWATDGTSDGTIMIKDGITSGSTNGPRYITVFSGKIYYDYDGELWASDGSPSGTNLFLQINPNFKSYPKEFMVMDTKMYFSAQRNGLGNELFVTNGSPAGTLPVLTNFNGYNANSLHNFFGRIFYSGKSDTQGQELWMSNGFDPGTAIVKDINLEANGVSDGLAANTEMVESNNYFYFSAVDHGQVNELYRSNGSSSETTKLTYSLGTNADGEPTDLIHFNTTLFFAAKYTTQGGLYKLGNGTSKVNELTNSAYINVFPNPTNQGLNFTHLIENSNYNLKITDLSGKLIIDENFVSKNSTYYFSNELDEGIYFITLSNDKNLIKFNSKIIYKK